MDLKGRGGRKPGERNYSFFVGMRAVYRISAHKDVYKEMLIWCFQQSVIEMKRVECGMKTGSTRPILCSGFRLFIFDGSSAACMTWLEALKVLCNISGCVSVLHGCKRTRFLKLFRSSARCPFATSIGLVGCIGERRTSSSFFLVYTNNLRDPIRLSTV